MNLRIRQQAVKVRANYLEMGVNAMLSTKGDLRFWRLLALIELHGAGL